MNFLKRDRPKIFIDVHFRRKRGMEAAIDVDIQFLLLILGKAGVAELDKNLLSKTMLYGECGDPI